MVDIKVLFAFVGDDTDKVYEKVKKKLRKYEKKEFTIESSDLKEYLGNEQYIGQFLSYTQWKYEEDIKNEFLFDSLELDRKGKTIEISSNQEQFEKFKYNQDRSEFSLGNIKLSNSIYLNL